MDDDFGTTHQRWAHLNPRDIRFPPRDRSEFPVETRKMTEEEMQKYFGSENGANTMEMPKAGEPLAKEWIDRIKNYQESKLMSRQRLAEFCGMGVAKLDSILHGKGKVTQDMLEWMQMIWPAEVQVEEIKVALKSQPTQHVAQPIPFNRPFADSLAKAFQDQTKSVPAPLIITPEDAKKIASNDPISEIMQDALRRINESIPRPRESITDLVARAHQNAVEKGFWESPREIGTLLMLITSEATEALEADRRGEPIVEELADIVIRTFDMAGGLSLDLESAIISKMQKNEGRDKLHGKRY